MKSFVHFVPGLLLLTTLSACLETSDTFQSGFTGGAWRGVLALRDFRLPVNDKDTIILLHDQFKEGELPFNFEVFYPASGRPYIEIINGSERIRCDSISIGRNRRTARDTINIYFPEYQSYIHADLRGGVMQGEWIVTTKKDYRIPFYAHAGRGYRFTNLKQSPEADLSGAWAVTFGIEKPESEQERAVGEFKQEGNRLEGTFRTETGDYRFLEGTVQGRKFWLSAFDGSHAFLFSGSIHGDSLYGEFLSGKTYKTLWSARKDPSFQLRDPSAITTLRDKPDALRFQFKTPEGKILRFPDPSLNDKIKIFTIMGTWCPNCRDEQVFLRDFLQQHPELADQVAVIGFAFERNQDETAANKHLAAYKQRMGIPFDLVYAGKADKDVAAGVFPVLNNVSAFPTMIIVDRQNRIRHIHTGFDGPATSKYTDFKNTFAQWIAEL